MIAHLYYSQAALLNRTIAAHDKPLFWTGQWKTHWDKLSKHYLWHRCIGPDHCTYYLTVRYEILMERWISAEPILTYCRVSLPPPPTKFFLACAHIKIPFGYQQIPPQLRSILTWTSMCPMFLARKPDHQVRWPQPIWPICLDFSGTCTK